MSPNEHRVIPRWAGWLAFGVGTGISFLMMSNAAQVPRGQLWGTLAMLAGTFGLLAGLGLFGEGDPAQATPLSGTVWGRLEGEPVWAEPRYGVTAAVAVLVVGGMLGGFAGLPWTIAIALLALVPASLRRPGLLVFVIVCAIYLPQLGVYGLWDPWETHYGEVAREVLSRDDWISLWWAQQDWFFSKPILIFWVEALSMGALGVNFHPDANPVHPEWAMRLPVFTVSIAAVLVTYFVVARLFGKRTGVLSALAMATMPQFFFLAHQAITDMLFVGTMAIAMALLVLAIATDPEDEPKQYRIAGLVVSARHLAIAGLVLTGLPQAMYLMSRNLTLYLPSSAIGAHQPGFAWHRDIFLSGSAGNAGVPGNSPLHYVQPAFDSIAAQPGIQGLIWLVGLIALLWMLKREHRTRGLLMFGFYYFCALSFMAKGIPGFALPGLVALLYLVASGRWSLLLDGHLKVGWGSLAVTTIGMPWYVAMYIRHGDPFTDRLLVHDHLDRLAVGVHMDTTTPGSIRYFIEQLGYATFPWAAVLPAAALAWLWYRRTASNRAAVPQPSVGAARATDDPAWADPDVAYHRRQTLLMMAMWLFATFALFSAMITKFHHYIFPAIPPAALLVGVLLDRAWGPSERRARGVVPLTAFLASLATVPLVLAVAGAHGNVRGIIPEGQGGDWVLQHPWPTAVVAVLALAGLALMAGALWAWYRRADREHDTSDGGWSASALGAALATGAVAAAFIGRDLAWQTTQRPQGDERLIDLYVYNYSRPWPAQFDYRAILTGFAVIASALLAFAVFRRLRPVMSRAFLGLGLLFAAWTLNVYMIDLSPHWSQRELIKEYYDLRKGPQEPLVAWQMNWKGENFYTGNHVYVFVKLDNTAIRNWIAENKGRTAYFIFEHTRLGIFRSLVPGRKLDLLTTKRDNNKFVLVKVKL